MAKQEKPQSTKSFTQTKMDLETWSYHSIIGKLNFLATNTCPNISMAVHNCARFCNNLTLLHGPFHTAIPDQSSSTDSSFIPTFARDLSLQLDSDESSSRSSLSLGVYLAFRRSDMADLGYSSSASINQDLHNSMSSCSIDWARIT